MTDLVKRLRGMADGTGGSCNPAEDADYVERLQAENAKLRKHVEAMAKHNEAYFIKSEALNAYRADFPKEPDK